MKLTGARSRWTGTRINACRKAYAHWPRAAGRWERRSPLLPVHQPSPRAGPCCLSFRIGLTPNQVTLISGPTTFAGIILLATADATYVTGAGVAVLLILGYPLGSADGQSQLRDRGHSTGNGSTTSSTPQLGTSPGHRDHLARPYNLPDIYLLDPLTFSIALIITFWHLVDRADARVGRPTLVPATSTSPALHAASTRCSSVLQLPVNSSVAAWPSSSSATRAYS